MTMQNMRRVIALVMVMALSAILGNAVIAQTATASPTVPATPQRSVGEFEFFGTISSLSGTSVTVNGRVYDISSAELHTSLTVGLQVKVHAIQNAAGVWVAREVEAWNGQQFDDDGETELFGTVTALSATTITVDGLVFDLSRAELKTAIAVGDFVKLHVILDASGVWVAREVEDWNPLLGDDDSADEDSVDDHGGHGSDDGSSIDDHGGQGSDDDGSDDHGGHGSDDDGGDDHGGHGSDDD